MCAGLIASLEHARPMECARLATTGSMELAVRVSVQTATVGSSVYYHRKANCSTKMTLEMKKKDSSISFMERQGQGSVTGKGWRKI